MRKGPAMDALRQLAKEQGWSKHKLKSLRGQILALETEEEREAFIGRLIRKGMK